MRQETEQRSPQQKICGYEYTVKRGDSFYLIAQRLGVPLRDLLDANSEINPARLMVGDVLCIPMEEDDAVTTPAQEPIGNAAKPTPPPIAAAPEPTPEAENAHTSVSQSAQQPVLVVTEAAQEAELAGMQGHVAMAAESTAELVIAAMPAMPETAPQPAEPEQSEPVVTPQEQCHMVQPGEQAGDILQAADISLKTLANANPGVDLDALKPGDLLCVPAENKPCGTARFYRVEEGGNIEQLALLLDVSVASLLRANPCLAPSDFKAGAVVSLP